ncbi:copper resistance CopC family protein [Microbacterium sp. 22242]|uniref:copper resistance CopC family protein n=1 Tax=Microbacterium sp. 22242 TaxID=3453896 RepID=UPI003F86F74E
MRIRHRLGALISAAVVGLVLATAGASAASAHDTLEQSDPAANATVKSLSAVTLTFSGDPLGAEGATVIQVIGPDKRYFETACPDLNGPAVSAPVTLGRAGTYEVLWRVVSSDGHPISGSYTFSYAPAAGGAPAQGSTTPKCGPAAPTSAPDASSTGSPGSAGDPGLWIGLGVGAVVLIGVGIGAWALARGRRS